LRQYDGVAIKAEDLLALGKDNGREFVRDRQVVYIYHDRIDLIGDKQASETKTFEAVSDALAELGQLANFIINSLNGSVVLMTADHGFMYQESALDDVDKSPLDEKPDGMLRAKKRFLIGQGIGNNSKAWCGNTSITAGTEVGEGSMDFWLPKGAARFHFAGGARFVHGSAMPQEIVIPVITLRESESEKTKTRIVEISLLGASNKVVTNKQRFEFIQTEAVSERVLPRTVQISIRDGETLISDEQSLTFDSDSQLMDKRKRTVMLTVRSGSYDRNKDYYLIARDAKTKVEVLRLPVRVDLAFANDF
ncbi:MAG: BREX-1 system phosphatase PglZ type A, partial [Nitrosomonadaceae bacterium]|nr:BREX-1 system phosphatase PglZ type A [Nitrosomonadaceae bacterium]